MPANELSLEGKSILDMCCGSRMFWFDKQDERAVFMDKRSEEHTLCDGRPLVISLTLSPTSPHCLSLTNHSRLSFSILRTWSASAPTAGRAKVREARPRNMAR